MHRLLELVADARMAYDMSAMNASATTIDAYLALLSDDKRAALERLRRDILAAAPGAEECISYQVPAIRLNGRMLVYFGAATKHCSFFPGAHPIETHKDELAGYPTSKGTIRFPANAPLPAALVRKLVEARIAEMNATSPKPARRRKASAAH